MKSDTAIVSETKADQVYRRLKSAILQGEAVPGEKLVVSQLAQMFHTSTIPVREAISRLEAEDLITVIAHTGIYVKDIDAERLKEIYPVRGILEGYAVRLAATRVTQADLDRLEAMLGEMDDAARTRDFALMGQINYEFHMTIYRISGNESLVRLIDDLWQKTIMARIVFKLTPRRATVSNREHRRILQALADGRAKDAERWIIRQSEKTLDLLIRRLAQRKVKASAD